jgi:hypothetical protein
MCFSFIALFNNDFQFDTCWTSTVLLIVLLKTQGHKDKLEKLSYLFSQILAN